MNCEFSNPVNYTGSPPAEAEPFAFSTMICTSDTKEEITGAGDFWISKQLDYGQILILTFLLIFVVGAVVKFCWNFTKQNSNQKI